MTTPRVSVLTPIYNTNPQHLRECIDSILAQTFTDFEFIILNDSPDNIELDELVKSYTDSRIVYVKNEKNMGISTSRNKLIDLSRGEYLAVFDHDDISVPERLEKEVAILDENGHIGVVSGWIDWFGDTKYTGVHIYPEQDTDIKTFLTNDCFIVHTACMIRKSVLIENNIRYEWLYSPAEDYQLWARLMDVTDFYNLQMVLAKYRFSGVNTSLRQQKQMHDARKKISLQVSDKHFAYRHEFEKRYVIKRIKLFGVIPFLKIKKSKKSNSKYCLLFGFFPLFKIY